MSRENVELVRRGNALFNAGDRDAALRVADLQQRAACQQAGREANKKGARWKPEST
jgi:hypothetical protein